MEVFRDKKDYGIRQSIHQLLDDIINDDSEYHDDGVITMVSPSIQMMRPTSKEVVKERVNWGVKIVGLEKRSIHINKVCKEIGKDYVHFGEVTCYAFISRRPGGACFNVHEDDEHVFIHVLSGEKDMIVNNRLYRIKAGEQIFIPSMTPHQPVNRKPSVMLSFGLE